MEILERKYHNIFEVLSLSLASAPTVNTESWQGRKVDNPMIELLNENITFPLMGYEDLDVYRKAVKPNLPWADEHFLERVGGEPLNPPPSFIRWVDGKSAETFLREDKFSHTYPERFWPKYVENDTEIPNDGLRFPVGDIQDIVNILVREPHTRQATFPMFLHEDLHAALNSERVPCSLHWSFFLRNNKLHIFYTLRSCDFLFHFRDDVYLAIRLLLWVLNECRKVDEFWNDVKPGNLFMNIFSLHTFEQNRIGL